MIRFTRKQKALARAVSYSELQSKYERSEQKLDNAARRGDLKAVDRAMKERRNYEYAILCKKAKKY
jgi:hypothetical protein